MEYSHRVEEDRMSQDMMSYDRMSKEQMSKEQISKDKISQLSAIKRRKSFASSYQNEIEQDEGYSSFQSSSESENSSDDQDSTDEDYEDDLKNTSAPLKNILRDNQQPQTNSEIRSEVERAIDEQLDQERAVYDLIDEEWAQYELKEEKRARDEVLEEMRKIKEEIEKEKVRERVLKEEEARIKHFQEERANHELLEAERTKDALLDWLDWVTKKLDFVYNYEPEEELITDCDYLPKCVGRVCDPYVNLESVHLASRIQEIRSCVTDNHKTQLKGRCWIKLKDNSELHGTWKSGRRTGPGGISTPDLENLGVLNISGTYVDGVLHGLARIQMLDGSLREGWFQNGFLSGPVRGLCKVTGLKWVGNYAGGRPKGMCWEALEGGAWLIQNPDDRRGCVYLYPDLVTALVGRWKEDGSLVSACPARLATWEILNDVVIPHCNITQQIQYRKWISSKESVACPVHQQDPYESQNVEVIQSSIEGSGEGLFAKKDLDSNIVVCFYNGIRIQPGESIGRTGYGLYIDWENEQTRKTSIIFDIPEKYQSSADYSATLAHKINHSFRPNCDWVRVIHPCYGRIPAICTIQKIKKGEELFIHYGMDMEEAPEWYLQSWEHYSLNPSSD